MFSYLFKKLVNQPLEAFYRNYVFKDIVKPKKPGYPASVWERTFTAEDQAREHFDVTFRKSIWSKTESRLQALDLLLLAATPTVVLAYFGLDMLAGIVGTATVFGVVILNGFAKACLGLWR